MNGALGSAGVLLGLLGALGGAGAVLVGILRGRPNLLRSAPAYGLLVFAGAFLAMAAMERALITRDFTVLFVAENGSSRTPARVQRGHALVGARGLDHPVGAGPRRATSSPCSASSGIASTTRWWVGRW